MGTVLVLAGAVAIGVFKTDPLAVLAVGVLLYLWNKQRLIKQAVTSLEYWKAKEFEFKEMASENKQSEKDRRLLVREARAERRRKVVGESKRLRMLDKFFTDDDRKNLKAMPVATRAEVAKIYGLKPEVLESWMILSEAELQKRKMGIDEDDVD